MISAITPNHLFPKQTYATLCTKIINKVALQTIIELAVATGLALLCSTFVASGGAILAIGVAAQTIVGLAIRIFLAYCEFQAKTDPRFQVPSFATWLAPTTFAIGAMNTNTLIHETGHLLAAKALLKNSQPTIKLVPYVSGITNFRIIAPTSVGQKIGTKVIQPLIAASGPLFSLGISSVFLISGLSLEKRAPKVSRILIVSALIDFLVHTVYAVSALFTNPRNLSHDFVCLWHAGIHPIVATIAILAVPLIIYNILRPLHKPILINFAMRFSMIFASIQSISLVPYSSIRVK